MYVGLIDQLMEFAAHTFVLNGCRQAGPYGAALCCTMKNFISASVASLRPGSELTVKNSAQLEIVGSYRMGRVSSNHPAEIRWWSRTSMVGSFTPSPLLYTANSWQSDEFVGG